MLAGQGRPEKDPGGVSPVFTGPLLHPDRLRGRYSPAGAVSGTPRPTGVLKSGVPSAFQVNFWP